MTLFIYSIVLVHRDWPLVSWNGSLVRPGRQGQIALHDIDIWHVISSVLFPKGWRFWGFSTSRLELSATARIEPNRLFTEYRCCHSATEAICINYYFVHELGCTLSPPTCDVISSQLYGFGSFFFYFTTSFNRTVLWEKCPISRRTRYSKTNLNSSAHTNWYCSLKSYPDVIHCHSAARSAC